MRESFANFFTDMRFFTCKKITDSLLCICERGKGPSPKRPERSQGDQPGSLKQNLTERATAQTVAGRKRRWKEGVSGGKKAPHRSDGGRTDQQGLNNEKVEISPAL